MSFGQFDSHVAVNMQGYGADIDYTQLPAGGTAEPVQYAWTMLPTPGLVESRFGPLDRKLSQTSMESGFQPDTMTSGIGIALTLLGRTPTTQELFHAHIHDLPHLGHPSPPMRLEPGLTYHFFDNSSRHTTPQPSTHYLSMPIPSFAGIAPTPYGWTSYSTQGPTSAQYELVSQRYQFNANYTEHNTAQIADPRIAEETLTALEGLPKELIGMVFGWAVATTYGGMSIALPTPQDVSSAAKKLVLSPGGRPSLLVATPKCMATAQEEVLRHATIRHEFTYSADVLAASVHPPLPTSMVARIRHLNLDLRLSGNETFHQNIFKKMEAAVQGGLKSLPSIRSFGLTVRFITRRLPLDTATRQSLIVQLVPIAQKLQVKQRLLRMGPWNDTGGHWSDFGEIKVAEPYAYLDVCESGDEDEDEYESGGQDSEEANLANVESEDVSGNEVDQYGHGDLGGHVTDGSKGDNDEDAEEEESRRALGIAKQVLENPGVFIDLL